MTQPQWDAIQREFPQLYRAFVAIAQIGLGRMGYIAGPFDGIIDDRTRTAVKTYQVARQLPASGVLDLQTYESIEKDTKSLDQRALYLPSLSIFLGFWDSNVSAKGTWVIDGEQQAFPIQTSDISCTHSSMTCVESTAIIQQFNDRPILALASVTYEVERWDDHEIVTKPDDKACVRYLLRISRKSKTVSGTRITLSGTKACAGVEGRDLRLSLVDGFQVVMPLVERETDTVQILLRADWKAIADGFSKASEAQRRLGLE